MKLFFKNHSVEIEVKKYSNGRTAIILLDGNDGMPYATATMNVDEAYVPLEEVVIKDYSENQGMLSFLERNNIVRRTGTYPLPFGSAPICILNPEGEWTPVDGDWSDEDGYDPSDKSVD